jgi:nucleoside-diphosphate-sugar epimerase
MSRYLVTGCAGFIGRHLSLKLLDEGHEIIGVDRISPYYDVNIKRANIETLVKFKKFVYLEKPILELSSADFENLDGIFHLAGQAGVRSSWGDDFKTYLDDNVLSSQFIFEKSSPNCPIVWASSSSVYGDAQDYPLAEGMSCSPISPYGISKLCVENLANTYSKIKHQSIIGLRYFTVYGPGQRPDMAFTKICKSLHNGIPFEIYGDGKQVRDFTYVSDIVQATIQIMQSKNSGVYNVAGGNEISLLDVIKIFEQVSNRELKVEFIPSQIGDVRKTAASTSKIRNEINWSPTFIIQSGILEQWNWSQNFFGGL